MHLSKNFQINLRLLGVEKSNFWHKTRPDFILHKYIEKKKQKRKAKESEELAKKRKKAKQNSDQMKQVAGRDELFDAGCATAQLQRSNWYLNVPNGYLSQPKRFFKKCLILAIVMALISTGEDCTCEPSILTDLNNRKRSISKHRQAGVILSEKVNDMIDNLRLGSGPYALIPTIETLVEKHPYQVLIFDMNQHKPKYMFPSTLDAKRHCIFLLWSEEEGQEYGHISVIKDLHAYFTLSLIHI